MKIDKWRWRKNLFYCIAFVLVWSLAAQCVGASSASAETRRMEAAFIERSPASKPLNEITPSNMMKKKECPDVHLQVDQCAFVRKHCTDAAVGYFNYLEFYYCHMANVKPLAFIILCIWLSTLFMTIGVAASDFFCPNLSTIAQALRMSESMAGVTFLALGNGSPDVFSTFAAMKAGSGSLAVGELIGAAAFISAVVAGSMAVVGPFKVARHAFLRDVCFFATAVLFSFFFLADGKVYLWECIVMICYYIAYVIMVVFWHWWSLRARKARETESSSTYASVANTSQECDAGVPSAAASAYEDDNENEEIRRLERTSMERDVDKNRREQEFADLNNNMRIARASLVNKSSRGQILAPAIRPSLFGALEVNFLQ